MTEFITEGARKLLSDSGWTAKVRYIDRKEEGQILGFRLTNARKLFDAAYSIQVFDKSTVSLSLGFSNDDHVSLTEDDGRTFLEWLRHEPDGPLPDQIWDKLGEPIDRARQPEYIDMGKAKLVDYLVQNSPQTFGKYGTLGVENAGDFYDTLLQLIQDPARDADITRRMIQQLELQAHTLYADANALLKSAAGAARTSAAHLVRLEAYGHVIAAQRCREAANFKRSTLDEPPEETPYPDAIEHTGPFNRSPLGAWGEEHEKHNAPRPLDVAPWDQARIIRETPPPAPAETQEPAGPHDVVVVTDNSVYYAGQVGEIESASDQERLIVNLPSARQGDPPRLVTLSRAQVRIISKATPQ